MNNALEIGSFSNEKTNKKGIYNYLEEEMGNDTGNKEEIEIEMKAQIVKIPGDSEAPAEGFFDAIKKRIDHYVGHLHEAHSYNHDNEYILRGYRINFHSCCKITRSLCMCHNETVNVWTHLVGALFTILLLIVTCIYIGPFGSKINDEQSWHLHRDIQKFNNYSDPYYSSNPIFHNIRLILDNVNIYSIKLNEAVSLENKNITLHGLLSNRLIFYNTPLEISHSHLLNINIKLKELNNYTCFSCVEDFLRNIFSGTNRGVDFLKTIFSGTEA